MAGYRVYMSPDIVFMFLLLALNGLSPTWISTLLRSCSTPYPLSSSKINPLAVPGRWCMFEVVALWSQKTLPHCIRPALITDALKIVLISLYTFMPLCAWQGYKCTTLRKCVVLLLLVWSIDCFQSFFLHIKNLDSQKKFIWYTQLRSPQCRYSHVLLLPCFASLETKYILNKNQLIEQGLAVWLLKIF